MMMMKRIFVKCTFLLVLFVSVLSDNCRISWIDSGREVSESQYIIQLSVVNTTGDLRTYFPNTIYDITITSKQLNRTFTQFYFAIWNVNKTMSYGTLDIREKELSMFHNGPYCINRVIDGPVSLAKFNLTIGWQSPPVNSGCINLRAAIKETELRYHVANVTVCQDPRVILDDPGEILRNCCACDDGKYELTFEGLWSRYTHPKHFPRREWLAVFPKVIGASHHHDYNFWQLYTKASPGLAKFAETGQTLDLELELKSNKRYITTFMKFRGANFQNKSRKAYAGIRVTRNHHVVSLIASIDPSPDWFVGASSVELCRPDCTWTESKTLNLYAYDAGIREGILYEDFNEVTEPQDIINSLNMTWPEPLNGLEAPFYDRNNNTHDVRPLARIHFKRIGNQEKRCLTTTLSQSECVTGFEEGPCSATCGKGFKLKKYNKTENYEKLNCAEYFPLTERISCIGYNKQCKRVVEDKDCEVTQWGEWTKCVQVCGQEKMTRSRSYKLKENDQACSERNKEQLIEYADCGNPKCPSDGIIYLCNPERYESWSEFTPCSVTVGDGFRIKYRKVKDYRKREKLESDYGEIDFGFNGCLMEVDTCVGTEETIPVVIDEDSETNEPTKIDEEDDIENGEIPAYCSIPPDFNGNCNESSNRYYYDAIKGDCLTFKYKGCEETKNAFTDEKLCIMTCMTNGLPEDCITSEWSSWSACGPNDTIQRRWRRLRLESRDRYRKCRLVDTQLCTKKLFGSSG